MQPRQKSHSLEEGGRTSNAKRKFSGKARLPGVKRKCKAVDPDKALETAQNHGRAGPSTTTDLEDVVSSVAEGMIPELNKTIETIISKRLDTSKGCHVSFNQSATCNNQHSVPKSDSDDVVCFDAISPSCSSNVKLGRVSGGLGWRDYNRQFRLKKA
uniref:Uncharacterized protein n=1 Tax=Magallana gigas TaxID=29159 RepID=A0A8W8LVB4_MAGGI